MTAASATGKRASNYSATLNPGPAFTDAGAVAARKFGDAATS